MFVLTDAAGLYLTRMLDEAKAPQDTAVRFVQESDALKPTLDRTRNGDTVFDHDGRRVLLLGPAESRRLASSRLDVQPSEQGPRLTILN